MSNRNLRHPNKYRVHTETGNRFKAPSETEIAQDRTLPNTHSLRLSKNNKKYNIISLRLKLLMLTSVKSQYLELSQLNRVCYMYFLFFELFLDSKGSKYSLLIIFTVVDVVPYDGC